MIYNHMTLQAGKLNGWNRNIPDTWRGSILWTTSLSNGMGWSSTIHAPPSLITVSSSGVSEGYMELVSTPPIF